MGGVGGGSTFGSFSNNSSGDYSNDTKNQSDTQTNANSTSQSTSSSTPNTTALWQQATGNAGNSVDQGGLTPAQQLATGFMQTNVDNQPMGFALQGLNSGGLSTIANAAVPTVNAPGQVGTSSVMAPTAASEVAPYLGLVSQSLIDPALANYDYGSQIANNNLNAQYAAGGGFNDSRTGVAQGTLAAQQALGRGQLASQLLTQGLNTAIGAGQGDAANALTASGQNASNTLGANEFSANQNLNAQLANQNASLSQEQAALSALGQMANNDIGTNTMGVGNAQALYNMSGGGLTNNLNIAGSQVPAFGTTNTNSANGTQFSDQSGTQTGSNTGNYTGASSGTSSGNQMSYQMGK